MNEALRNKQRIENVDPIQSNAQVTGRLLAMQYDTAQSLAFAIRNEYGQRSLQKIACQAAMAYRAENLLPAFNMQGLL